MRGHPDGMGDSRRFVVVNCSQLSRRSEDKVVTTLVLWQSTDQKRSVKRACRGCVMLWRKDVKCAEMKRVGSWLRKEAGASLSWGSFLLVYIIHQYLPIIHHPTTKSKQTNSLRHL